MTMRITFTINYDRGASWTETWYRAGESHAATLLSIRQAGGWLDRRRKLMHPFYNIVSASVSNVNQARDGEDDEYGSAGIGNYITVGNRPNEPAEPGVGIRVRFYTGTDARHWRTSYLRGVSEDATDDGKTIDPGSNYTANMTDFLGMLVGQAYQLRLQTRTVSSALANIVMLDNQIIRIITADPIAGATVGKVLEIADALGVSNIRGKYTILQVENPNTFRVRKRQRKSYGTLPPVGGTVYLLDYTYEPVSAMQRPALGTRKTRGPFAGQRGKRPVRRD